MRRRLRYLRTERELCYRDLGGLTFDLHRFGGRKDELLAAKFARLGQLDGELRALEKALDDREPVTVLREAGVRACPRCAAIHSSEDNFCPHCGASVTGKDERSPTPAGASGSKAPARPPSPAALPAHAPQSPADTSGGPPDSGVAPRPAPNRAPAGPSSGSPAPAGQPPRAPTASPVPAGRQGSDAIPSAE